MENIDHVTLENPKTPLFPTAAKFGVLYAIVVIIMQLVLSFLHLDPQNLMMTLISWAIMIGGIVLLHLQYRDKVNSGFMTYGQGIGIAALYGVVAGIITAIFMYIFYLYISPETLEMIQSQAIENMYSQGLSEEQIEQSMEFAKYFMTPEFICGVMILGTPMTFVFISLIVSIFTKKG